MGYIGRSCLRRNKRERLYMKEFVDELKKQLQRELTSHERKGVYAYTQKLMAYNSNKIEGSTLTSEQTASLFDTGTITSNGDFIYRTKDVEEMTGHFKMFNEIVKSLDKPLTTELIRLFHYQLKSGVFEDYANGYPIGEYKSRANGVSDIKTELPENIPMRMERLVEEYNNGSRTLSDIVRFHAEYEHIHPFQDGNGRTGRAIILKQCLDSGIVPVIISDDEKITYYSVLHMAQIEKNYQPMMEFFEKEQQRYYENVKAYISIPTEKSRNAVRAAAEFSERLKTLIFPRTVQVEVRDLSDSVQCIVRYGALVFIIDYLKGCIFLLRNGERLSENELNSEEMSFYTDITKHLKETGKDYFKNL